MAVLGSGLLLSLRIRNSERVFNRNCSLRMRFNIDELNVDLIAGLYRSEVYVVIPFLISKSNTLIGNGYD
jgi:hypothetical protein